MSHTLNPLELPLWGSRLIEASAGTGKTWTIAALYVRLVLGHPAGAGDSAGFGRPLTPAEILVMTFTRAATRELSDRIRARLVEAARIFRGGAFDASDTFMTGLLAAYEEGPARAQAAWRLAIAAESMDDAAVHTIDAWCQRVLREHAFDSGSLFDEELTRNEAVMRVQAAQDYWRQQIYPLHGEALDVALSVWKSMDALAKDARELTSKDIPALDTHETLAACIELAQAGRRAGLAALKEGWAERARKMKAWIDAELAKPSCVLNKAKFKAKDYTGWLEALASWANDPEAETPDMKTGAERFTPSGMRKASRHPEALELPSCFAEFGVLMKALADVPPIAVALRWHAAAHIVARMAMLKAQSGTFGFADQLARLDQALDAELRGEAAVRLRARILAQYPVALIDEFQDTSPVQSRIFDRLYRIADNDRQTGLLLIGDPKQSIYGFRGADIQSYLTARRATAGRHYVLGTNHRSTTAVVEAVNHLFKEAEEREEEAAFMYATPPSPPNAPVQNPLPFVPVQARGRKEALVDTNGPIPALTLALDATLRSKDDSQGAFAARCGDHIVAMLNDESAGFQASDGLFTRLRPADIAVLVRTGREAAAVQRELRRRMVASVYLSDQNSVFDSHEARDLLHWLHAVASPLDIRLARAALATRTVGLSIAELICLADDEEAFDARSEQLRTLHGVWQQQGILSMLRQTLHVLDLPARWLGSASGSVSGNPAPVEDGERRLTNFLHLAELLQAASAEVEGEQALIRWLAEQMDDAASTKSDEQIVRLESDADLVKVVTVHASKGLEYPVVLLPFASSFRAVERRFTTAVSLPDDEGQRSLHLHLTDPVLSAAEKERHREDLRLLYVALTRARHAVWVGLAALKVGRKEVCVSEKSAIGYVLHGQALHAGELKPRIEALVASCPAISLVDAEEAIGLPGARLRPRGALPALRAPQAYQASFDRRWSIGSFSALVRALPATGAMAASVAVVRDDEVRDLGAQGGESELSGEGGAASSAGASAAPDAAPGGPWHRFPRGAMPGNFLHDQLEWLAGEGFDLDTSAERQQQLQRRCERAGHGARSADVQDWLSRAIATPLGPVNATLQGVSHRLPEMEFWLPTQQLDAGAVDRLCRAHLLDGRARPMLPEREMHGMLMGFADIVFEHGGRYWVLDYKSNHLGDADRDYTASALAGAMADHRYDVQAAIYMLALHRLLRARLGQEYDPARQLGGAVFYFLRGLRGPSHGCYHVPPSPALLDALDRVLNPAEERVL